MTYPLILRPEAEEDLLDAYRWYDERVSDLGPRFLESVERTLTQVENNPQAFAEVHEGVSVVRLFVPSHMASTFRLKAKELSFSPSSTHRVTPACGWSEHVLPPNKAADSQPATRLARR